MQVTEELDNGTCKQRRQVVASRIMSAVLIVMLRLDGGTAMAGSSCEARDPATQGAIGAGRATELSQGTPAIKSAQPADRGVVSVLPRARRVLTEPPGTVLRQATVEVRMEPLLARCPQPFAADAGGGYLVVQYNFRSSR
jgi:hypothetical protein